MLLERIAAFRESNRAAHAQRKKAGFCSFGWIGFALKTILRRRRIQTLLPDTLPATTGRIGREYHRFGNAIHGRRVSAGWYAVKIEARQFHFSFEDWRSPHRRDWTNSTKTKGRTADLLAATRDSSVFAPGNSCLPRGFVCANAFSMNLPFQFSGFGFT